MTENYEEAHGEPSIANQNDCSAIRRAMNAKRSRLPRLDVKAQRIDARRASATMVGMCRGSTCGCKRKSRWYWCLPNFLRILRDEKKIILIDIVDKTIGIVKIILKTMKCVLSKEQPELQLSSNACIDINFILIVQIKTFSPPSYKKQYKYKKNARSAWSLQIWSHERQSQAND